MDFDDTNLYHVMFMPPPASTSYCQAKCSKQESERIDGKKKKLENFKESRHFKSFTVRRLIFKVMPRIELIVPLCIAGTNILVIATEVWGVEKGRGDKTES